MRCATNIKGKVISEMQLNKSIRRYAILRIGMVTSISNLISVDKACIASWQILS